jgi:hypothetical protein
MKKSFFTKRYLEIVRIIGMVSILIFLLDIRFVFLTDYMRGFTLSFGITAMVISSILLLHKPFMKKSQIAEQDERLMMIRGKVMTSTYLIHYWLMVILIVVFGMIERMYFFSVILAVVFLVEYLVMVVLDIYYKKKF